MNWKSIFIIYSEVEICNSQLHFQGSVLCIEDFSEQINDSVNNQQLKLLTVILDVEDKIQEVYLKSLDIVEKFLDFASLIGYCEVQMLDHIITIPTYSEVGKEFEGLSSKIIHKRTYKEGITATDLLKIGQIGVVNQYLEIALSFLRRALSTQSLEEKIIMLASCLEKIASVESNEYVKTKCAECGHEKDTSMKATKRFLKDILVKKGASNKEVQNFLDRDRNKVAHGGGVRDVKFYSELKESILKVQHLVVEIMSEKLGVDLVNSGTSVIDLPAAIYKYIKQADGSFDLTGEDAIRFYSIAGISRVNNMSERAKSNLTLDLALTTDSSNPMLNPEFQKTFFPK